MFPTKENLKKIRDFIKEGYISESFHPTISGVRVLNYSHKCQYNSFWNEETRNCRGLILDRHDRAVARPFPRFFNINEIEETKIENLPSELPEIREKIDGFLLIVSCHLDHLLVATRGSFTSEQALRSEQWLREQDLTKDSFHEGYTYLFEGVFSEHKIVIDYGDFSGLYLLVVRITEDGTELPLEPEAQQLGVRYPLLVNKSIRELLDYCKRADYQEGEGFVLRYSNGLRVKMKTDEYIRLHKIITGVSVKQIWLKLSTNEGVGGLLVGVPDEFYRWIREKKEAFEKAYSELYSRCYNAYRDTLEVSKNFVVPADMTLGPKMLRRGQADYILSNYKDIAPMIFGLLDGRNVEEMIWKRIQPHGEDVFKKEM